jgi:Lsr2
MAQKVILVDDIDGTEGTETLTYTFDGQEYEIDLSDANAKKFRAAVGPYIEKSREVHRQPLTPVTATRRRSTGSRRDDLQEVRAWAAANGIEVSPRGRIKQEVLDRYDAEHSNSR